MESATHLHPVVSRDAKREQIHVGFCVGMRALKSFHNYQDDFY